MNLRVRRVDLVYEDLNILKVTLRFIVLGTWRLAVVFIGVEKLGGEFVLGRV